MSSSEEEEEFDYPDEGDVCWSDDAEVLYVEEMHHDVFMMSTGNHPPVRRTTPVSPRPASECAVCLDGMSSSSSSSYCAHQCGTPFHRRCVSGLTRCPICRAEGPWKELLFLPPIPKTTT